MQENLDEKQIIHLLPRSYLKTVAALVGRDRKTTSFHVNPIYCDNLQPIKHKLSKKSAILGALLIQDWQRSRTKNGDLYITNMSDLARRLKTTPQELKIFLLNLGGFEYPFRHLSHKNQSKRTLEVTEGLLFRVNFIGYNGWSSYNEDYRIGTRLASYVKNERIKEVMVTLNPDFEREISLGKDNNFIYVSDSFIDFGLSLSDIGFKLLCYSASNKPEYSIGFDKLVPHLGLADTIANQGKPRILSRLNQGFCELHDLEHLQNWEFDNNKKMYRWIYSNKVIRHQDFCKTGDIE